MSPPAVPVIVRNKALAAGATQWLDDLPEIVAGLEREWSIAVGRPYADATERVSTGLLCTRIGLQPVGREMLAAADRLAG
jgi:hypothetical protein